MTVFGVLKALLYTCGSYPKLAAPHRLSGTGDYELCLLTSMASSLSVMERARLWVLEFKRGRRTIGALGVGRGIVEAVGASLKELGQEPMVNVSILAVLLTFLDIMNEEVYGCFHEALANLYKSLEVSEVGEAVELVKALKRLPSTAPLLDQSGLSERRVEVEALTVRDVFRELTKHSNLFEPFTNVDRALDAINLAERMLREHKEVNKALSHTFLAMVRERDPVLARELERRKTLAELLKLDFELRRRGITFVYLLPYVGFASLYLVVKGF